MATADMIAQAGIAPAAAKIIGEFIDAQQADDAELADLAANLTATATELNKLAGVTAGTVAASKGAVVGASKDVNEWNVFGNMVHGSNSTDRVTMKGHYMNPAVIAVAVPTIANDAAENGDSVAVDVSGAFSIQPAVGDAVIPIPMEALPTDCLLCGAYVTATDQITVTFMSKEGGGGVTGANKNFNFLIIDLT